MTASGLPTAGTAQCAAPPFPPEAHAAPGAALDQTLRAIIARAAAVPRGLALLHRGPLETAAVLLGTHPDAIARVRAALERPEPRGAVMREFARAREGRHTAAPPPDRPAQPRRAEDLVRAACQQPERMAVLASAAVEYAAIAFGVHPDLVLAARELVSRRGVPVALEDV